MGKIEDFYIELYVTKIENGWVVKALFEAGMDRKKIFCKTKKEIEPAIQRIITKTFESLK